MKKSLLIPFFLPVAVCWFATLPLEKSPATFHSAAESALFHTIPPPPIDSHILFPTAATCRNCHGHDSTGRALVSTSGVDVNIYDDWRSTMMANSAKDPYWRAKVRQEILVNPSHSLALQDKCTSCHAPGGHYQAKLKEHKPYYLLDDLYGDTLGLDGVNCQTCHAQSPKSLGKLHSGALNFDTNNIRISYGPYETAFAVPMKNFLGITPVYGPHIGASGLCAGCHTLLTETADLNGVLTGETFVEQATYHEWLNSRYDEAHDNISCQNCHIPSLADEIIISGNYSFLTPRFPFGLHEMAGANTMMLGLLKANRDKLGISASAEQFDSTIAATLRLLQRQSVDLQLTPVDFNGDSIRFLVSLNNKTGHKFPSGYPSRRAWIEFELRNQQGEPIFHSGKLNPNGNLSGENSGVEPHYDRITDPSQVQIYELAPGDVNGQFTTILERCKAPIKDNRLTPQGFTLADPVYDTTRIVGDALQDPNFNRAADGTQGTGADQIVYCIPTHGYSGKVNAIVRIWYQSLPLKWIQPMFNWSAPEIDSFRLMFESADNSPVLIAEKSLENLVIDPVATQEIEETEIKIGPSPTRDGLLTITTIAGLRVTRIKAWNSAGRLVCNQSSNLPVQLPKERGIYFISVETNRGKITRKVIRE